MHATVSSALVGILIAMVGLRADGGDSRTSRRTSIHATAKAFASSQSAADSTARSDWNRLRARACHVTARSHDNARLARVH